MPETKELTHEPNDQESKSNSEGSDQNQKPGAPIRQITKRVLAICLAIFVWYLFSDRYAPFTDQARVKTLVVPIVPRVSGYLTEIHVRLHSLVTKDQALFQIDRRPYELAVKKAEADLDNVAQQVGALTATVKAAIGRLGVAKAQLDRAQRNFNRTQQVLKQNPGALSQADLDRAETSLAQAVERVASAEADLEKAKQQLGESGKNNAQLRAALVALEQKQLDLAFTTLRAPSDGVIENFNLDIGYYAQAGKALAAFVTTHDVWIEAYMRENNIGNIDPGEEAEFVLDVRPGRVFKGKVRSIGYGVSYGSGNSGNRGNLPSVSGAKGWLRDPQRFPVIIGVDDKEILKYIRSGGQADVLVYASRNPILNLIGWFQIRISSLLSYVR